MAQKKNLFPTLCLVILIASAIVGKVLYETDPLQPLEYKLYDYMIRLRQRKAATPVVVLTRFI